MKNILIAGSSNVDITHVGDFIPNEGQTLLAKSSYMSLGGKGLNQAVSSKRLSTGEVYFLSVIGDDFLSKYMKNGFLHTFDVKKLMIWSFSAACYKTSIGIITAALPIIRG